MRRVILLILIAAISLAGCGSTNEPAGTKNPAGTTEPPQTNTPAETATPTPSSTPAAQETPAPSQAISEIEDIAISLVTDMSNGRFEKAMKHYSYNDQMKSALSEDILRDQLWGALIQSYGDFREIAGTTISQYQGYDVVSVKTAFENGKILINVFFDDGYFIVGLRIAPDTSADERDDKQIPYGVKETPVTFGKSGWEMPGILTTPEGGGPFPVVILVHGSGPLDRDSTVGANKPFRDIAWGLAQMGIATLRYDKRTYVYGNKMTGDFTVYDEAVEDAALALEFLKGQDAVDKSRICILGHSLGGTLIPRIAAQTPDAAGYIVMSGVVSPLEDVMLYQYRYLSELDGVVTEQEKQAIEDVEDAREFIKSLGPDSGNALILGAPASYWIDLRGYNPAVEAKSIEKPLFVLQGERDYQVTMDEFMLWKDALEGLNNVTLKSYEGLNHLYIYGEKKSEPSEYNQPGAVDGRVIEDIADWILSIR